MDDKDLINAFDNLYKFTEKLMKFLKEIEHDNQSPASIKLQAKAYRWGWEERAKEPPCQKN